MSSGANHCMFMSNLAEATYGEVIATPLWDPLEHNTTTLGLSKNSFQSERLCRNRQISDFRHGAQQIGGDIGLELSYSDFDVMMEAMAMGTWTADVLKAGATRRSYNIMRRFGDLTGGEKDHHVFYGCEFNSFQLSVTPDAIITGSFGVIGKSMNTIVGEPVGSTFSAVSGNSVLDSFTGTLNEGGVPVGIVTEISFTWNNGLEPRFVVGDNETILPEVGQSNLTGQLTAYFETAALIDKFINETETSIDFTLPDSGGSSYLFNIPRIKYSGGQPDVTGPGSIFLTMPFQAIYDTVELSNIVITRTP